MIENREVAHEISHLMLEIGARLDASVSLVHKNCSAEEFQRYNKIVASLMAEMLLEVMDPLYLAHPDIKPIELDRRNV